MTLKCHRDKGSGLVWYTFTGEPLSSQPHFINALVTRLGGVSRGPFASLNLSGVVGDDPSAVRTNHVRLFSALGLSEGQIVSPQQVHGSRVACVNSDDGGTDIPQTDALITRAPDVALLLRFADCTPVLFYDPIHHAAGLAHAGWRGVAAGIAPATVTAMVDHFGSQPESLWAGIGPCIGPDHYVVGEEVVTAIQATLPHDTPPIAWPHQQAWRIDLPGAIEAQLHAVGVQTIAQSRLCTACHTDEWYSHRAEKGRTGRFGVVVMLA